MSPPEVWGPAIWSLFHTLSEKINEHSYNAIYQQLFLQFQKICKYLPCPECSRDASIFLEKIKIRNLKTKHDFKNLFYLFHNYVNAKKRKTLFNYASINIYKNYRIINVINSFFAHYNTKGNMKLLTESFQRQFIIKDFKKWFTSNISAFVQPNIPPPVNNVHIEEQVSENVKEHVVEPIEESHVEPDLKQIEEQVVEHVKDSVAEPDVEQIEEPTEEPVEEPVEEQDVEQFKEPIGKPDVEKFEEHTEEPIAEPDVEQIEEPTEEPVEEQDETNMNTQVFEDDLPQ